MTDLKIDGVSKRFGSIEVLRSISLAIASGERVAVVGESGSGKTTLLRTIAGLERPDAGRLWFGGHEVTNLPANKRGVGVVFQDYATYPRLTVAENLSVSVVGTGVDRNEKDARLQKIAGWLGLEQLLKRLPTELSGGQLQRVALGKALMGRPKILLLDEPFSQLDVRLAEQMRRMLVECHQQYGMTQIMVTHHPLDALTSVDKLAVLHRGQLVQLGTPDEIRRAPATLFAAELTSPCGLNVLSSAELLGQVMTVGPWTVSPSDLSTCGRCLPHRGGDIVFEANLVSLRDLGIVQLAELRWGTAQVLMQCSAGMVLPQPGDKLTAVIKRADLMTFAD